jgi:hypothetical protein
VIPFVLESYGALGNKAVNLMKKLAKLREPDYSDTLNYGYDMIAVALAQGNYIIDREGVPHARRRGMHYLSAASGINVH